MTDPSLIADIASIPLYDPLDAHERADIAFGLRRVSFKAGDVLMLQGAEPDGAYFILSGRVQVTTKLPGGGETLIGEPGPGSTLGELALIRSGPRSATVRATCSVETIFADRRLFNAALAQLRPGAFKVLRQLAVLLAERLRVLHGRIHHAVMGEDRAYESLPLPPPPNGSPEGGAPTGFDVRAFLPILPCFREFDSVGIHAILSRARIIEPRRGYNLCDVGETPEHGFVVVRGAVASGFIRAGCIHLMNVLGPGCFCAIGSLIEGRSVSASYVVLENAVLLELARERFSELWHSTDQTALALLSSVNSHQATMVSRATNHLTRLVGLSRLSRQFRKGSEITV